MRLIDADSLIHLVTDSTILGDGFKNAFCALVNGEPTVKVQKTGHWIVKEKGLKVTIYECSECKRHVMDDTGYDVVKDYPYCHCGARMVGEKDE